MKFTQKEQVFLIMLNGPEKWWYAPDFMSGENFIGYESSARLSELATKYPSIIESKREGRYTYRRIKWEHVHEWSHLVPWRLWVKAKRLRDEVPF